VAASRPFGTIASGIEKTVGRAKDSSRKGTEVDEADKGVLQKALRDADGVLSGELASGIAKDAGRNIGESAARVVATRSGAAAGMVAGAVAGPLGSAVGSVIGAVAGNLIGTGVASLFNDEDEQIAQPSFEDTRLQVGENLEPFTYHSTHALSTHSATLKRATTV
jgi:outer membrane lipoprotein SlyB